MSPCRRAWSFTGLIDAVIDHNDVLAAAQVAAAHLQKLLVALLRSPELV